MISHDEYMRFREHDVVRDQLDQYFRSVMRSQFYSTGSAALYAFLLTVLDEFGTDEDMTIEKFMDLAGKVYREKFPPIREERQEAA